MIQESYFCSELVAAALQLMGLLKRDLPACDYWPRSFSSKKKLHLERGARYGEEQLIDFRL
jgi:hypothetical protein